MYRKRLNVSQDTLDTPWIRPWFHAASVLLLQRVVVMLLKSKQQIIRQQLQLKLISKVHNYHKLLNQDKSQKKKGTSKSINHWILQ